MSNKDRLVERALAKMRARDVLDADEEAVFRGALGDLREIPAGRTFVRAGENLTHSILLLDGIACRYKDLAGGERQIMELHVGGDFVDLHGFLLKRLDHNIGSMTPILIATVPHERLREITRSHPHLARLLWLSTLIDAAIHRERILSIGRRDAVGRIAHLFCEMAVRMEVIGLAEGGRYRLPITQGDIADTTGLTPVHVNRMLKKLRDEGLLTFRGGEVTVGDRERLAREAEFDPAYLNLEREPR